NPLEPTSHPLLPRSGAAVSEPMRSSRATSSHWRTQPVRCHRAPKVARVPETRKKHWEQSGRARLKPAQELREAHPGCATCWVGPGQRRVLLVPPLLRLAPWPSEAAMRSTRTLTRGTPRVKRSAAPRKVARPAKARAAPLTRTKRQAHRDRRQAPPAHRHERACAEAAECESASRCLPHYPTRIRSFATYRARRGALPRSRRTLFGARVARPRKQRRIRSARFDLYSAPAERSRRARTTSSFRCLPGSALAHGKSAARAPAGSGHRTERARSKRSGGWHLAHKHRRVGRNQIGPPLARGP